MIPDEKIARLWGYLERSFNLTIYQIAPDCEDAHSVSALVTMHEDPQLNMLTLPDRFEGHDVRYNPVRKAPPRKMTLA